MKNNNQKGQGTLTCKHGKSWLKKGERRSRVIIWFKESTTLECLDYSTIYSSTEGGRGRVLMYLCKHPGGHVTSSWMCR